MPILNDKIQKKLAHFGLGSRREIEDWIRSGRISINNVPAKIGDRIAKADVVKIDGRLIPLQTQQKLARKTILYYKPEGELVSRKAEDDRPLVFDALPKLKRQRWVAIGRLDCNSSGLILFTTDGNLAHTLMHPKFEIEREYSVRIRGKLTKEQMQILQKGVRLEDGMARFEKIEEKGGQNANHWYNVTLKEGRNREVRRMFESQGLIVSRLIRIRFGNILLPRNLRIGKYVEVEESRIQALFNPTHTV